jgi:hypothetical protein
MLAMATAIILSLAPATAGAQGACRFVLGFADLASRLGTATAGTCTENQRTITGEESFDLGAVILTLPPGTAVQRTTTGVFSWSPVTNNTLFRDAWGEWALTTTGVSARSWDDATSATRPQTPSSPARSDPGADCAAIALDATRDVPRTYGQQLVAAWGGDDAANAAEDMCRTAAASDGARGVDCFKSAFSVARGQERLFPGQGASAYQGAYSRCISGR